MLSGPLSVVSVAQQPRFEKSLFFDDFTAHAVCADGYIGKASVGKCSAVSLPYTLGGCGQRNVWNQLGAEMFNYNIAVNSLYLPTFSVTATCRNGSGRGKALPCQGGQAALQAGRL